MGRYVEGSDRTQVTLLPECMDDYIGKDNPVRVVEAFVEELDLELSPVLARRDRDRDRDRDGPRRGYDDVPA